MERDELLRQILALPANVDVGVQVGDDHLDIAKVVVWGDAQFGALQCRSNDVRDLMLAIGTIPAEVEPRRADKE